MPRALTLKQIELKRKRLGLRAAQAKAEREELALEAAKRAADGNGGPYWRLDGELAKALGIDKSYLSKLKRRDWFPRKSKAGWDEALARRAIAQNLPNGAQLIGEESATVAPDAPTLAVLDALSTSTDPLELSRCATQLSARRLADAYRRGLAGGNEAGDLKRALEEQRRMEADYLDLAVKRGELVPRATLAVVAGGLARYMLRALEEVEAMLSPQVEQWTKGKAFRKRTTDGRRREVQAWTRKRTREIREAAAEQLEAIVEAAIDEVGSP